MASEPALDFDVFHGELTANRAQLFVRAPRNGEWADCTLHGYVQGPRCEYSHTLPARFPLADLGAGPTLLARATITDPCYWTSDLPHLYDVHLELRRGGETIAREQRMVGLRGIGTRGGNLIREGKVWVPRGVDIQLVGQSAQQLHDHLLVGRCAAPPLDLLVEASRRGGYLIVDVDAGTVDLPAALRSLARWPAVMMAAIRGGTSLDRSLQQVAPNLLLAQAVGSEEALQPAPWAAALVMRVEMASDPGRSVARATQIPVLLQRTAESPIKSPAEARAACDQLQRDLAPIAQFAGYLIG